MLFFLPNSIFGHKKWVVVAFVLFLFSFSPPSALKRKAERKGACSPAWSTEKETLFDVSGFLGLDLKTSAGSLLRDCLTCISPGIPYPAEFNLAASFPKDLTGYRLSSSNLATWSFVARNRLLRGPGCDR